VVGLSKRGQEFTKVGSCGVKTFFLFRCLFSFSWECRWQTVEVASMLQVHFVNPASVMNNLYTGQVSTFSAN